MSSTNSGGWFRVANAAVDRMAEVKVYGYAVYGVLARHADKNGLAFPSVQRIAKLTAMSRRKVFQTILDLETAGWIAVERGATKNGRPQSNRYKLLPLASSAPDAPFDHEGVVHGVHPRGAYGAPGVVHGVHPGGAPYAPEQDLMKETQLKEDPRKETAASPPTPTLGDVCVWWNGMHSRKLVTAGVNAEHPAEALQGAWKRVQKSPSLRVLFQDLPTIERAIEASDFLREGGWFTLCKLLGGRNKDRELIVEKLLSGGYKNGNGRRARVGAGQRFDPATADEDRRF